MARKKNIKRQSKSPEQIKTSRKKKKPVNVEKRPKR
jgi:hypothetical protein